MTSFKETIKKAVPLFIVFLLFAAGSHAGENGKITFTFAPEDGITYIQKLTTKREKQTADAGAEMDESFSVTRISVKKTKEGWDITAKPENVVMKRNGQVVNNPIVDILSRITVVYKLAEDGALKDIVGYEGLKKAINDQFPSELGRKIAMMLNSQMLKQRDMTVWNGRVGNFLGKTVSIGDVWEQDAPFDMPDGKRIDYRMKTLFKSIQPCGKTRCVTIEQVYDSRPDAITDFTNKFLQSVSGAEKKKAGESAPKLKKSETSIKGRTTRLIEPATMLIHEEVLERTIQMAVKMPGAGAQTPVTMVEKRIYKYEY